MTTFILLACLAQTPQEARWLQTVNAARQANKVGPLAWDQRLANSGRWEAQNRWYSHEGYFQHGPARFGFPMREVPDNGLDRNFANQTFFNVSEGTAPTMSGDIREAINAFKNETGKRPHWKDFANPYWNRVGIAYDFTDRKTYIFVYGRD